MSTAPSNFSVIIAAGGTGERLSTDIPKQYMTMGGKAILRRTLDIFVSMKGMQDICVVINKDHHDLYKQAVEGLDNVRFCIGGNTRQESVLNGLNALSHLTADDLVLIHDAARPFVKKSEINSLRDSLYHHKAASLAVPIVDTLRYGDDNDIAAQNVNRDNMWAMQTPQGFHYGVLRNAHDNCDQDQIYTDDTALVSATGIDVKLVHGGKQNFKITTQEDLHMAQHLLSTEMRTGMGYDVHAFDDEAKDVKTITLCGVDIEHDRKLKGHSDADVGLHALTDAILGAIGEGDIGLHFPPSNMDFKNMDSAVFLEHAMTLLGEKHGKLMNADITLICERPKIGQYREQIVERVSDLLSLSTDRVNIKATTSEKLGFTGREEGIAAQAVVSVSLPADDEGRDHV